MKALIYCIAALIFLPLTSSADGVEFISFERGGYERARIKAAKEGKLLFMDFYAKWCTPCKWMDETTFSDSRIIDKLNDDFVAVKVDIDDMEGFELKSRFNIRYLPTILIFNTEGKLVERVEETLSPSKMGEILNRYDAAKDIGVVTQPFNTSPTMPNIEVQDENHDNENNSKDDMTLSRDQYKSYFEEQNVSYRMQLGVFQSIEGAKTKADQLSELFLEEINIIQDDRLGVPMYKVVMGSFKSLSEAESFRKILKDKYHLDSILY